MTQHRSRTTLGDPGARPRRPLPDPKDTHRSTHTQLALFGLTIAWYEAYNPAIAQVNPSTCVSRPSRKSSPAEPNPISQSTAFKAGSRRSSPNTRSRAPDASPFSPRANPFSEMAATLERRAIKQRGGARETKSGSQLTPRWREMDSNFLFRANRRRLQPLFLGLHGAWRETFKASSDRPSPRRCHPSSCPPRQSRCRAASRPVAAYYRASRATKAALSAVGEHRGAGSLNPSPSSGESVANSIWASGL